MLLEDTFPAAGELGCALCRAVFCRSWPEEAASAGGMVVSLSLEVCTSKGEKTTIRKSTCDLGEKESTVAKVNCDLGDVSFCAQVGTPQLLLIFREQLSASCKL